MSEQQTMIRRTDVNPWLPSPEFSFDSGISLGRRPHRSRRGRPLLSTGLAIIGLLALGVTSASAASLTLQGSFTTIADARFVVSLPSGGWLVGGPNGLQNYDANGQPVGSIYGASQLAGNIITNGVLYGSNLIVFGYQAGGGQGFDEIFDPVGRSFLGAHNIGNPVELGGGAVIGTKIFIPDFSSVSLWQSPDGGNTWGSGSLAGESGSANGLVTNNQYIFLAQFNIVQRYFYPNGNTPTSISIPGSNGLVGGTQIDSAGDMAFNDGQNVFQCAFDGTRCFKITAMALSGLGYPASLPSGCVLVPSTAGSVFVFSPPGNSCGVTTPPVTPGGTTPGATNIGGTTSGGGVPDLNIQVDAISKEMSADRSGSVTAAGRPFYTYGHLFVRFTITNDGGAAGRAETDFHLGDGTRVRFSGWEDAEASTNPVDLWGELGEAGPRGTTLSDPKCTVGAVTVDPGNAATITCGLVFTNSLKFGPPPTGSIQVLVGLHQQDDTNNVDGDTLGAGKDSQGDDSVMEHVTIVSGAASVDVRNLSGKELPIFDGTAPPSPPAAAHGQATPAAAGGTIELAVVRTGHDAHAAAASRCQWLANEGARFRSSPATKGICGTPVWIHVKRGRGPGGRTARTSSRWYYKLTSPLPKGCYTAYARSVDPSGVTQTQFTAKRGNRRSLCVHH